ncbi:CAP domain-containing protein [Clostridiaceae bacterium]|nr:CAP domain-containing protein [Clostridiaceae bacterium]RKI14152.1 CAP domain-containing protein [bacterium 1XD21-70]
MSNTAYAASVGTYNIPGGQAVVIGGSSQSELREVLNQLQGNRQGSCSGNLFLGGGGNASGKPSWGNSGGGCSWDLTCPDSGSDSSNGCSWDFSFGGLGGGCPGTGNPGGGWDCGQGEPGNPDNPGNPDKPGNPDRPGNPDKPGNPDNPGNPDKPGNPDNPGKPDKPGNPDNPGDPDKPVNPDKPELPDVNQDAYAKQVVSLVNEERAKAGLAALEVHTGAESAALVRAKEIERSFSHTRPNGSGFSTVLTSAGIRFQSAGENIAYGQESPAAVMNDWMNSSGHRANILNSNFTSIAVGHYRNSAGVDYWVQLFLR